MRRVAGLLLAVLASAGPAAAAGSRVELYPATPAPGEVFRVRVDAEQPVSVRFGGREFDLWPADGGGWEGLVAVDRDARAGEADAVVVGRDGRPLGTAPVPVRAREYPVQRLTVSEKLVTLSAEDRARADREAVRIRAALASRTPRRLWTGPFSLPVDAPVSSPFGTRRYYNGKRRGYHSGLDLAAPRGTPVAAPAAGRVVLVGDFFYTGNTVFVDHGHGLVTAYFHLDAVSVSEGDRVETGQELGRVGSTGRSTGPHLHWGVYLSGRKADPLSLVRATAGPAVGGGGP